MRLAPLAVILLTAAVGLADDKPKPRPKLLGTIKVSRAVETVHWTPDAKHLILIGDGKGLIVGRDQLGEDTPAKPVAEFDLPVGGGRGLGVTPDGTEVSVLTNASGRFNAETRLCFWTLKDLLDGKKKTKPDRMVSLEADHPNDLTMAADGKSFLAVTKEHLPFQPGEPLKHRGKVLRVNTKTGDTSEELLTLDEAEATLVNATATPDGTRVFAHYQTTDENVIRCIDTTTKKKKWERRFDEAVVGTSGLAPRLSPDGSVVIAFCSKAGRPVDPNQLPQVGQPQFQGQTTLRPQLLNATTGAVIADLGGDDSLSCDLGGFSHDGKLVFGWLTTSTGLRHVVWDTKTGKPLKTWVRGNGVVAADFAPGKYELASVERFDPNGGAVIPPNAPPYATPLLDVRSSLYEPFIVPQMPIPTAPPVATGNTSIVGVWDLSSLVQ